MVLKKLKSMKIQGNIKLHIFFRYGLFLLATTPVFTQQLNWYNNGLIHISPSAKVICIGDFENKEEGSFINNGEVIFKADIINHGRLFFNQAQVSLTRIEGSGSQRLTGTRPGKFHNLELNKLGTLEIEVENDIEIYGQTIFNRGVLQTRETSGLISFYSQATVSHANNNSYINGFVRKYGNNTFEFPIGHKGYYRTIRVHGNTNEFDVYEAIYHYENSDRYFSHTSKPDNITHINTAEYWELVDYHTTDHVFISLRLSAETMSNNFLDTDVKPTIVAWDYQRQQWVDLGGVIDEEYEIISTVFKVTLYSAYTFALKEVGFDPEDIEFFNAVNPKDIHGNQYFRIKGIHNYPENELKIFNRWGALVYQTKAYDTEENVFEGISNGNITIKKKKQLPEGTYFYVLKRVNPQDGKQLTDTGYIYLIR